MGLHASSVGKGITVVQSGAAIVIIGHPSETDEPGPPGTGMGGIATSLGHNTPLQSANGTCVNSRDAAVLALSDRCAQREEAGSVIVELLAASGEGVDGQ